RKFAQFGTWSALMNALSWQLPAIMLGAFFSSAVVGFYALGFRILQMPMNLVGSAISQVFVQRAAESRKDGSLPELVEELFHRLVAVSLFPLLILTVVGRDLYIVIFGDRWAEAGIYAQILSVWAFFWFVASPLSQLFTVLEEQELSLKINAVLLATRVLSLAIGGYMQNVYLALLLYAVTGILVYGFMNVRVLQLSGVGAGRYAAIVWRALLKFVPFGIVLLALVLAGLSSVVVLLAAVTAFIAHCWLVYRQFS
ncbi:MAG: oligosaccharide flippase family protein, partial [Woeseiaceae bacterium]|nr:oligosaccharide flippase family protein [Woeseiaceae bacterium]